MTSARPATTTPVATPARPDVDQVLFTRKSPELSVETSGPRRITVGKAATYSLSLANSGDLAAADVVVHVSVPEWAEVVHVHGSIGNTVQAAGGVGFEWRVGSLAGGRVEELTIELVPRQSQPFELGVRWTYSPLASQTTVEVQEPKLGLAISGPNEVMFGAREVYRLTVTNPGNGEAENVVIHLLPISGDGEVARHSIGVMAPGDTQVVEIELTARQVGNLEVRAEATGDNGLKANISQSVNVRRADLQVAMSGPKAMYAGAATNYDIRVANTGNATAENVRVTTMLPEGVEFVSALEGGRFNSSTREVAWTIGEVASGGEKALGLQCKLNAPGVGIVETTATADHDIHSHATTSTHVLAVADLTLEVADPQGPVPVGSQTEYVVRIENRGTRSAPSVEVLVYFSEGVEPVRVDGGAHEIMPGAVIIQPISNMAPGQEVKFTIKAQAQVAGTHRMRAELVCKALGTNLSQQESTLFYDMDDLSNSDGSTPTSGSSGVAPTANRGSTMLR